MAAPPVVGRDDGEEENSHSMFRAMLAAVLTNLLLVSRWCRQYVSLLAAGLLCLAFFAHGARQQHQPRQERPWHNELVWPSYCDGRMFDFQQECTYNTLPRLARLTLSNADDGTDAAVAPAVHSDRHAMATVLLDDLHLGFWKKKPYGCFARDNGQLHFNRRTKSAGTRARNETNLCARCDIDQRAYQVNGTIPGTHAVSIDIIAAAVHDEKIFALHHGGRCQDIAGGEYCPIVVPGICAAAGTHFGIKAKETTHANDNITALLVLMGGSRVGSTWLVGMLDSHPDIHMRGEGTNANPCNDNENETERLRLVRGFLNRPGKHRVRGHKLGTFVLNDPASIAVRRLWANQKHLRVICLHRSNSWEQAMSATHKAAMMQACGNKSAQCDGIYPHALPPSAFWKFFINHRWFTDTCWSWVPRAEAVMALEYDELTKNTEEVMEQLWDFIGVPQLSTTVSTAEVIHSHQAATPGLDRKGASAGAVKASLDDANTQFKMHREESELTNLNAALQIDLIRRMRNSTAWHRDQKPGCAVRKPNQVLPLLNKQRVLKWCTCNEHGCGQAQDRAILEDIVPTPYHKTLSLDACSEEVWRETLTVV